MAPCRPRQSVVSDWYRNTDIAELRNHFIYFLPSFKAEITEKGMIVDDEIDGEFIVVFCFEFRSKNTPKYLAFGYRIK